MTCIVLKNSSHLKFIDHIKSSNNPKPSETFISTSAIKESIVTREKDTYIGKSRKTTRFPYQKALQSLAIHAVHSWYRNAIRSKKLCADTFDPHKQAHLTLFVCLLAIISTCIYTHVITHTITFTADEYCLIPHAYVYMQLVMAKLTLDTSTYDMHYQPDSRVVCNNISNDI